MHETKGPEGAELALKISGLGQKEGWPKDISVTSRRLGTDTLSPILRSEGDGIEDAHICIWVVKDKNIF